MPELAQYESVLQDSWLWAGVPLAMVAPESVGHTNAPAELPPTESVSLTSPAPVPPPSLLSEVISTIHFPEPDSAPEPSPAEPLPPQPSPSAEPLVQDDRAYDDPVPATFTPVPDPVSAPPLSLPTPPVQPEPIPSTLPPPPPAPPISVTEQALLQFRRAQFDEALATFQQLQLANPADPDLLYNLGVCLRSLGRYREAADAFQAALKLAPDMPEARAGLAWCFLNLRDGKEALAIFDAKIRRNPDDVHARRGRAQALHLQGRLEEAKNAYIALLGNDPSNPDILANLIAIAADQRDYPALRQYSEHLLKSQNRSRQALAGLLTADLADARYADAAKRAEDLLDIEPTSFEALFNLALAHQLDGQGTEALRLYSKALELNNQRVEPWLNIGYLEWQAGDLTRARADVQKALSLDPQNPIALWNMATLLEHLQDFHAAEEYFARLVAQDHQQAAASAPNWFHLGLNRMRNQKWPEAVAAFEKCVDLDPGMPEAAVYLGVACTFAGNTAAATANFDRVLHLNPPYIPALRCQTALAITDGDIATAPELEAQLADRGETTPEFCYNLGLLQYQHQQYESAAHSFRRAIAKKPTFTDALLNLGYTLEKLGRHEEAAEAWHNALLLQPDMTLAYFQGV